MDSFPWGHQSTKQLGKATGCGYGARHCLVLVPREEIQGLTGQKQLTKTPGRGAAEGRGGFCLAGLGWQCQKMPPRCTAPSSVRGKSPQGIFQPPPPAAGRAAGTRAMGRAATGLQLTSQGCGCVRGFWEQGRGKQHWDGQPRGQQLPPHLPDFIPCPKGDQARGEGAEPFPRSPGELTKAPLSLDLQRVEIRGNRARLQFPPRLICVLPLGACCRFLQRLSCSSTSDKGQLIWK